MIGSLAVVVAVFLLQMEATFSHPTRAELQKYIMQLVGIVVFC